MRKLLKKIGDYCYKKVSNFNFRKLRRQFLAGISGLVIMYAIILLINNPELINVTVTVCVIVVAVLILLYNVTVLLMDKE